MAVIRVSSAIANGDTLTMPSHQEHDLIIAVIYRHDSTTAPTEVSGWRFRQSRAVGSSSIRLYDKVAASGSETFGTWTNATQVAAVVYRSDADLLLCCVGGGVASGTSTAITYSGVGTSTGMSNVNSYVLGTAGVRSNSSDAEGAPSGMTNIVSIAGTSDGELTVHDTNAEVANWNTTAFTASTTEVYNSITIGIQETDHPVPTGGGGEFFHGSF
jgi:hypothetical protein